MATMNRFVIDLVTEEDLSERRLQTIARELAEHVYLFSEDEDEVNQKADKTYYGHKHDSTEDVCRFCRSHSRDGINGDTQV